MARMIKTCLCLLMAFWLTGCQQDKTALDANGIPKTLIIAAPNGGVPDLAKSRLEPMRIYLEKKLGIPVEFIFTTEYTGVIEGLRAKKVHMAMMTPFAYVLASQSHDLTPMVAIGENGQPTMYHSVIFTNKKTGLKNMDDVKRRAKSLTLCFSDPASTSGHLVPSAYLTSIGLNPDNAFKETMFAGSHPAAVLTVKSGKIDLGCTTVEYGIEMLERMKMLNPNDVVVLWKSEPIASEPVVMRSDINPQFTKKVKDIFLNMAKDNPSALNIYLKAYMQHPERLSFMAIQDSMYNSLRKVVSGTKNMALTIK